MGLALLKLKLGACPRRELACAVECNDHSSSSLEPCLSSCRGCRGSVEALSTSVGALSVDNCRSSVGPLSTSVGLVGAGLTVYMCSSCRASKLCRAVEPVELSSCRTSVGPLSDLCRTSVGRLSDLCRTSVRRDTQPGCRLCRALISVRTCLPI